MEGIDRRIYAKLPHLPAESDLARDYLADLQFALDFARESRKEMLTRVLECFAEVLPACSGAACSGLIDAAEDIPHNFVAREEHFGEHLFVHRKGAIHLHEGQVGMIPGSMGTASYLVTGRGNPFGFCSGSHGAGRAMSRSEAFRTISDEEFLHSVDDVVHRHDVRMKTRRPRRTKTFGMSCAAQKDLVKIAAELRPLLSVKGR